MLSPMAGITNVAFRQLALELLDKYAVEEGDGLKGPHPLLIDEMVAARAISSRVQKAIANLQFSPIERFRSVQLYAKEPEWAYAAAKMISKENLADHIDLNFGCPVKKVTLSGGGSAVPTKPDLLREIIKSAKSGISDGLLERHQSGAKDQMGEKKPALANIPFLRSFVQG